MLMIFISLPTSVVMDLKVTGYCFKGINMLVSAFPLFLMGSTI